jgi:hypothetical protein
VPRPNFQAYDTEPKDLSTRDFAPITTPSTRRAAADVRGGRAAHPDRSAVEQELAADPDLRVRLAAVESALSAAADAFAAADAASVINPEPAARRASAAVAAWQVGRATAQPAARPAVDDRRHRRWVVPAGVAAGVALVVGGVALKDRADRTRATTAATTEPAAEAAANDAAETPLVVSAATSLFDLSAAGGEDEASAAARPGAARPAGRAGGRRPGPAVPTVLRRADPAGRGPPARGDRPPVSSRARAAVPSAGRRVASIARHCWPHNLEP